MRHFHKNHNPITAFWLAALLTLLALQAIAQSAPMSMAAQKIAWPKDVVAMRLTGADWNRLAGRYPILCDWVMQDMKGIPEALLSASDGVKTEQAMMVSVIAQLGGEAKPISAALSKCANSEQRLSLYIKACELRRAKRLMPMIKGGITTIAFAKHYNMGGSHYAYTEGQSDAQAERNFMPGGELCLLKMDGLYGKEQTLFKTGGVIRNPNISYDGTKLLFSMKQSDVTDDYHLYEWNLSSSKMRQLTDGLGFADYEGTYLPSGDIVFNSSRAVQTVDCWWTEVSNLYTCNADGKLMRRLTFDQVHDNYPSVLPDGRITYTRWEYNDRGQLFPQPLFQMNADGTEQTEYYGNNSWFPTTIIQARGLGDSGKVIAILTGHHSRQGGKLAIIDPAKGRQENEGVQLIAPVRNTPADRIDAYGQDGELFQYPYAVDDQHFLVSYLPKGWASPAPNAYGIYLVDVNGNRELLSWDASISSNQPVPVMKRKTPLVRPSAVDYTKTTGSYYLHDVYSGPGLKDIKRGTVKKLRVVALDYRAAGVKSNSNNGPAGGALVSTPIGVDNTSWDPKIVLGEATVQEDGSAMFEVPARRPVYFQAVDAKGEVVQTMRSWTTLQPGEKFSCTGCHESKNSAPARYSGRSLAMKQGVEKLKPFLRRPVHGFSFNKDVQPIMDRNCTRCHDNRGAALHSDEVDNFNRNNAISLSTIGSEWSYTTNNPGAGWEAENFDASKWAKAKAGFGTNNIESGLGSPWNTPDIWMRRQFNVDKSDEMKRLVVYLSFDEDVRVVLNGKQIFAAQGFITNYKAVAAVNDAFSALKQGANTLAVSCHQTIGGQYIDVGLYAIKEPPKSGHPFSLLGLPVEGDQVRRFTDSYMALTQRGRSTELVNWISPQSVPSMLPPYSAGAATSKLLAKLDRGHGGVKLTQDERDTLACWIDLLVPFSGDYIEANTWNDDETEKYMHFLAKRMRGEALEQRNIADTLLSIGKKPINDVNAVRIEYLSADQTGLQTIDDYSKPGSLVISHAYRPGDQVLIYGPKFIWVRFGKDAPESLVYNPEGVVVVPLPVRSAQAYPPSLIQAAAHTIMARAATQQEVSARRNLALNPFDVRGVSGSYPHASSNSECRNEPIFAARNAIDGFTQNAGHGNWPFQSWGPEQVKDGWWKVEFGRSVSVDSVRITVRADFPHDKVWDSAVLEFSDGSRVPITLKADAAAQEFKFAKRQTSYVRINNLVQTEPVGWCALTEVEVFGNDMPTALKDEGVSISMNPTILRVVQEQLGKDIVTREDVLSIVELNLVGQQLTDIGDLAQFENLQKLNVSDNLLTDLSPLSELTSLVDLNASNDPFMSEEQKKARKGKNHFTDFSFLKKLTNITHIGFTDVALTNIEFVRMLPNLEHLWAYSNPGLKDISPMGACKKLKKAYFYDCPVTDISVCRQLPQLEGIAINVTGVTDLRPLEGCVSLSYLDAHNAEIRDLTPISKMTKMNYLTLEGNHLTDITPLLSMQSMKWLTIGANPELTYDRIFPVVTQLKGLVELNTAGTDLTAEQKATLEAAMPWCKMKYQW